MDKRDVSRADVENILRTHKIDYVDIKKFPKSGQKAVYMVICESQTLILKVYNVTPYFTLDQMEYSCFTDMDELDVQKNEEIRLLTMYIVREVSAAKRCSIFPRMLVTQNIEEYKVEEHIYKYYFEEAVSGVPMNESAYYTKPNDIPRIASFLDEALTQVKSMWDITYVHRDIKPNNIIINGEEVKFIDPGLARSADDETLTRTGMAMGTPRYWAPEQQEIQSNYNWTFKTDLYPLGLIAIEMFIPEIRKLSESYLKDMQFVYEKWCEREDSPVAKAFFREVIIKLSSEKIFRRANSIEKLQEKICEFKED
ncbi:TPA: protein kinase [Enterococcus faecium]|uniref:protein kinase domain-containing protein n=1 Tax=Enterococcus faecium TaxID=1352 RepID=UPI001B2BF79E|nr:serine/threonine-protein kinase [Enterococcus faecium]MBQ1134764.1 protein kinase [Enterococcus faecium]MCE3119352.1 protein kinase [Enterococcus faecium]MCU2031939.1 protein kinase [Enterococcus faecium]MCU2138206.1 protein kinase [Enterococcus faecium]MCZ1189096.1 protein kinase [Enterococcus faecium]